jgi:DNA-binding response OmpR family regulator
MRILLVEDSQRLRKSVGTALRRTGYAVDVSGDGEEGLWFAESNEYDAVILDIMLPKLDGLSVLKQLRDSGGTAHVILLTAKDTVQDRVRGLQLGADDYLIKPFALEELLARVDALCRRAYGTKQPRIVIEDLEIDTTGKEVFRHGQPVTLKPREYQLLEYLARRAGVVVTRSEIETHIYNDEIDPVSNVVESAVCSLRRKLGGVEGAPLIHTRRGLGYVLKPRDEA